MKKNKKKFNNIQKSLKGFIIDEEGFVSKENILKIGLGTISALGIIGSLSNVVAQHTDIAHINTPHANTAEVNQFPRGGGTCAPVTHSSTPHSNTPHSSTPHINVHSAY